MSNHNIILDLGDGIHILDIADAIWVGNGKRLFINHSGRYTELNCNDPEALLNKIKAAFKANGATVIKGQPNKEAQN